MKCKKQKVYFYFPYSQKVRTGINQRNEDYGENGHQSQDCDQSDDSSLTDQDFCNNENYIDDDQSSSDDNCSPQEQQKNITHKQSQQPAKKSNQRIDTDIIPRPIISREESIEYLSFKTGPEQAPLPHSYKLFTTQDKGSGGPRFLRSTACTLCMDPSLTKQSNIPLGLIISPLAEACTAEAPVPLIDLSQKSILRCLRCKAYVNPNFKFQNHGSSVVCNICKYVMTTPPQYLSDTSSSLSAAEEMGQSELCRGVYEFIAPKEYDLPHRGQSIKLMFCLEMTAESVKRQIFAPTLNSILASLDYVQSPATTDIAICTYDHRMSYYSIPKDLNNDISIIYVSDLDDPACPLPKEKMFLNIEKDRDKINYLVEKLLKSSETLYQAKEAQHPVHQPSTVSVGYIVSSLQQMMDNSLGRIIVFASQISQAGFGKLNKRGETGAINAENEKALYLPQSQVYSDLGRTCLVAKIGVDLFVFPSSYFDLATVSALTTWTGGTLYFYPYFNPSHDAEKLHYEIFRNITRVQGYGAVMTLRTGQGIAPQEYITLSGNHQVRELDLSVIDADKTIAITFQQEEKIEEAFTHMQYALLYTNIRCQRVIRVINFSLRISASLSDVFKSGDVDATFNIIARKFVSTVPKTKFPAIQESLQQSVIDLLSSYKKHCASNSNPNQLILPENFKMLPLYISCLLKKDVFREGLDVSPDQRFYEMARICNDSPLALNNWIYPKFYPIHSIYEEPESQLMSGTELDQRVITPSSIPATIDRIDPKGVYLIDSGETIYLYIMKEANSELLLHIFETYSTEAISKMSSVPDMDVDYNMRVRAIIDQLRRNKNSAYQNVVILVQNDQTTKILKQLLVEDYMKFQESYGDFLCTIHKLICQKLKQ